MLELSSVTMIWAASLVPVVVSYLIYPLFIAAVGGLAEGGPRKVMLRNTESTGLPSVTVLVAAHNEAEVITQRIENLLSCDYPSERLQVLIASDGSTDGTEELVSSVNDDRVTLIPLHPNRGKSFALNQAIPQARGEIIIMSDANTLFDDQALKQLVWRLGQSDHPLAVCGKLILVDPDSGDNVDSLYWRFESWQKKNEGRVAATLGANGGIYAFRRADYRSIPNNTILDDMTIPLLMKLHIGGSIVYDEKAIAYEDAAPSMADEFGRRVRIGVGAFQSIPLLWRLLLPRYGFTALAFFCHKILRWFTPHFLLLSMLITLAGLGYPPMQVVALLYVAASLLAWRGRKISGGSAVARASRLLSMFVDMNIALGLGFFRWLTQEQTGTWRRTARGT